MPRRALVRCSRCRRLRRPGPTCPGCGGRPVDRARWARLSRQLIAEHRADHGNVCFGFTWSEDPYGVGPVHPSHETTDLVVHHKDRDQSNWQRDNLIVICRALNTALG